MQADIHSAVRAHVCACVCLSPKAALTNDYKPSGLNQQNFTVTAVQTRSLR